MSSLTEISESKFTISIKPKENIIQSAFKNFITFGFMAFCIYISQGSTWWTFASGVIFFVFLVVKVGSVINKDATTFSSTKDAIDFLNKQEEK
jgi:uncharacterized membrane protein YecN with MAPEG domain